MSIAESEREIEKACDAFYSAYKSSLIKTEYQWKNAFNASRESNLSLKSLSRTAEFMKRNLKEEYDDNINKFLYIYFRNKPQSIESEIIDICKIAVRISVHKEIDRIFD
ncbi:hypothetical protein JT279_001720 [Listeria monocytogenes]|uniref:hypothetical protein n=1 Tax=Listeria TaxID=1637 RepID=UPI00117F24CF|nr:MULTISPECIES: hypothetical protein [Listeria]EAE6587864.1 hypothetical protein [Listeria monocytogenes]EEO1968939.1 hypothetical protein [Listeria monocytogenes]EEO6643574.1 hypothetical protein [Listeria monocytogenes]EEO9130636.1 hypothetical protein [Listeria monocytogenes]EHB7034373.1 hypothetical protein [Listeria monocytogenes]